MRSDHPLARDAAAAAHRPETSPARIHGPLGRGWQLFATALSFGVFGLGGLCFAGFVTPLLKLTCGPARRRRLAQRIIHHGLRLFVALMCRLGLISYRVEGLEALRLPGQVIIANHPSLIDVVFLISFLPEADCVVKHELLRNPFTRGALRTAGYLSNRSSEALLTHGVARLRTGHSIIVFPEGTRSTDGRPLRFQRGYANLALYAEAAVRPVEIRCTPIALTKGTPWYRLPPQRIDFFFRVHPAIASTTFRGDLARATAARRLTRHLESCYQRWLADGARTAPSPHGNDAARR